MKKVSLKDIAAAVGVAPSTVSLVLNGKGKEMRISEKLETSIRLYAKAAGYQPNKIAVSLRTGSSKILGLIVEDISNNFFASLAKVIEGEAKKFGYNVVFCSTENDVRKGRELLNVLSQQQVDGFLITPTQGMCEQIQSLVNRGYPVVLMDRNFPDLNVSCVLANNYSGVSQGIQHLIQSGRQCIGFITVDMNLTQMNEREAAFINIMSTHSQTKNKRILKVPLNTSQDAAVELISRFLEHHEDLDAVFFATNYLGIAGLESIKNLGIDIPRQLAVMCFDDHDIFRLHTPSISSIRQPTIEIAVNAVRLLVEQILNVGVPLLPDRLEFDTTLMVRDSTAPRLISSL